MFYFSLWRDSPSWLLTMATGVSFQKCHATLSSCQLTHSCLTSSLCPLWQPFQAYAVYFWCQAGPGRLKGNLSPLNKHHTPLGDKRWFEEIFAYTCIGNLRRGAAPCARTGLCVQRGRHGREASRESKQSMADPRLQISITASCNSHGMRRNTGQRGVLGAECSEAGRQRQTLSQCPQSTERDPVKALQEGLGQNLLGIAGGTS